MRLPFLYTKKNQVVTVSKFGGLNQNIVTGEGEFADMKNISDRHFPAICNRKPRGIMDTYVEDPHGIIYKNGLFYVDDTKCYYNGALVSGLTVSQNDKTLVGMGAYICIFPDGKIYNTHDGSIRTIAVTMPQSGTVTMAPVTTGSVFTKITANGIHNNFSKNDGITISGCNNTEYNFNGTHVITEIGTNYIIIPGAITTTYTQASGITFSRELPQMDFVCELDNRLWGCSSANHEIYASKLGDPTNWRVYDALSDSSYAVTVGSDGDFTGCIAHLGYALFFKENTIHMMYGNKPSNFSLNTKTLPGVREGCERSLCIVNETLYYVGRNGVYSFDGSVPTKISDKITGEIKDAVCSHEDGRLYVSCLLDSKQTVLVYDPKTQIWDKEDDDKFLFATYGDGKLYYINPAKYITTISGSREETIRWFIESGDIVEGSLDEKYISKIKLNVMMENGSEMNIFLKCDDEPLWRHKGFIECTKNKTYTLPIVPQRCNKFRYRLEGRGNFKLLGLSREVEGGSELHGSVQFSHHR